MKRSLIACLVLGLGASTASAQFNLRGSDTLLDYTQRLITVCQPAVTGTIYTGGGSSLGEAEMETVNRQEIAPMSRFIDATSCSTGGQSNVANDGQGCKIALDGLGIWADAVEANTCSTLRYSGFMEVTDQNEHAGIDNGAAGDTTNIFLVDGPDADTDLDDYQFTDWKDVLRIVYGGQHEHKVAAACAEAPPSRSSVVTHKKCNSDVRHSLVNSWGNVFQQGSGCTAGDNDNCQQLKHAFRRDDLSGTTDVFLEVLALPAIQSVPFCNGADQFDEDPVRRDCTENGEQVCNGVPYANNGGAATLVTLGNDTGHRGGFNVNPSNATSADLGLVLPLVLPASGAYHDTLNCPGLGGPFKYREMPFAALAAQQKCPDGTSRQSDQCRTPGRGPSASPTFGCTNPRTNIHATALLTNVDGRVYNLIPRNADGTIQTITRGATTRKLVRANYKLHTTQAIPGGTLPGGICNHPDATDQIGCFAAASPCSFGFSGDSASFAGSNKALMLREPEVECDDTNGDDNIDNDADSNIDEEGELCTGVLPVITNVRRLNNSFGTGMGSSCASLGDYNIRYPLSRVLYVNAIDGFDSSSPSDPWVDTSAIDGDDDDMDGNIDEAFDDDATFDRIPNTREEQDIVRCACNRFYSDQAVNFAGFFTADDVTVGGAGATCNDANDVFTNTACRAEVRTCP